MKKICLLFLGLCLGSFYGLNAQSITVTGTVTDASSVPIFGVNILEKNTTNGVVADFDGNFSIKVNGPNAILLFSFLGMKTTEVKLNGRAQMDVVMEEDAAQLDEVVLVGYGTQKRQAATGAVEVADLDTYSAVPVNNIIDRVKGALPGVNFGASNSAGGVPGISIRGQNSTFASNSPLIVVDGVIYNGSLGDISPNDIEDFTVLKDASAAAVYGSRSSNGVILIQTRKGAGINGKPKLNVSLSTGITNELNRVALYDAEGYIQRLLDLRADAGLDADPNLVNTYLQDIERENYEATPNHIATLPKPFDPFIQTGFNSKADISISNRTEKTSYYISTSLTDQKGVIINDNYKNIAGRVNITTNLTDWFKLNLRSSYSMRDFSGREPGLDQATALSPYANLYDENGNPEFYPQTTTSLRNPLLFIPTSDRDVRNNLTALVSAEFKIPWIKGLSYNLNYSNALRWNEDFVFFDESTVQGLTPRGTGSRSYSRDHNLLIDNILKYNYTIKEKHDLDVTFVYSKEVNKTEGFTARSEGFDNTVLGYYKLEDGQSQSVSTGGGENSGIGNLARATYTFDNRYSLTGSFRRDGFSGFSKNKKYGNFSSLGANWNISNEKFLEDSETISSLALKVSYGSTGNRGIDSYQTLARVGTSKFVYAGDPNYTVTQTISSLALDDLGWEKTTGWNFGLNFGLFDQRISGSIDMYKTETTDLIFSVRPPSISGAGNVLDNIGQIDNKGIDIGLHTVNVVAGDFKWNSDISFQLNRNKVVSILGDDNDGDGVEDDLINSGFFIGKTLGTIYSYNVQGIYQQEDADSGNILDGAVPGDYIIEDLPDENGVKDNQITSANDRQFLGDTNPNFRWSFTNTLRYKNFTLLAYLYSIWGGDDHFLSATDTPYRDFTAGRRDLNHPVYDYWTPTNANAHYPRPLYGVDGRYKVNRYVDRSFIKLQKVALSYDMTDVVRPMGINGLTLSLSADNLFTYAPHWKGLDPETNQGNTWTARPSLRNYLFTVAFNF